MEEDGQSVSRNNDGVLMSRDDDEALVAWDHDEVLVDDGVLVQQGIMMKSWQVKGAGGMR